MHPAPEHNFIHHFWPLPYNQKNYGKKHKRYGQYRGQLTQLFIEALLFTKKRLSAAGYCPETGAAAGLQQNRNDQPDTDYDVYSRH